METQLNKVDNNAATVKFSEPRGFGTTLRSDLKETFFPDDPFSRFRNEENPFRRAKKAVKYFVPIFDWLPNYNLRLFRMDLIAGLTITSLAIPQGISYAKLANIPAIVGLYSSFVPPLIYAVFGDSKHLAVGTVAACSLLISETIGKVASPLSEPTLYLHLVFTAAFVTGVFQSLIGFLRLGVLVDFLSHSTITGFMGGTAVIICCQQLKGFLGLKHFTTKTNVVSVVQAIANNRHEWKWESALVGTIFLIFLQFTRYIKRPHLFWVSVMSPMVVVIVGSVFAYLIYGDCKPLISISQSSNSIGPVVSKSRLTSYWAYRPRRSLLSYDGDRNSVE